MCASIAAILSASHVLTARTRRHEGKNVSGWSMADARRRPCALLVDVLERGRDRRDRARGAGSRRSARRLRALATLCCRLAARNGRELSDLSPGLLLPRSGHLVLAATAIGVA